MLKKLRGLCLRRVTDVVTTFKSCDFSTFIPRLLAVLRARIERLPRENTQSPVGLLETLHEMAHNDALAHFLFDAGGGGAGPGAGREGGAGGGGWVLNAVFACMAAPAAAYAVRRAVLEVADVLVRQAGARGHAEAMAAHLSPLLRHVYTHLKALVDRGGPAQAGDMQAQVRDAKHMHTHARAHTLSRSLSRSLAPSLAPSLLSTCCGCSSKHMQPLSD